MGKLKTGAWCYYNNNTANGRTYGKLYNWYAVNDPRGLATAGWHVASDAEWSTMIEYLGGINLAGSKLKETGTVHWVSPNTGATDERLFTTLPGGYSYYTGGHFLMGSLGYWWTSTESDISNGSSVSIGYDAPSINRNNYTKRYGFSVRCVRD